MATPLLPATAASQRKPITHVNKQHDTTQRTKHNTTENSQEIFRSAKQSLLSKTGFAKLFCKCGKNLLSVLTP